MASNNLLDTGTEDNNASLPPSEASSPAAPAPEDVPLRTTSPSTSATSLPTLPISELVFDSDTALPPPSGSLHDSKHNPDFRVRNHAKLIKMSTIISDLHSLLHAAHRSEDQSAFDCLHAHILKAGEGLDSLAQSPLVAQADEDSRFRDEVLGVGRIVPPNLENDWYRVQHEAVAGDAIECDAIECDALATKRVQCARKAYEAKLDEVWSDSESDSGASISEKQQSESEDTTLVEDSPEEFALPHTASSITLDGSWGQAASDLMAMDYLDYCCPEVLHRAADFLETIQRCNKDVMKTYGITLDDLDVAEYEASMSEAVEEVQFESVQPIIETVETLRRGNERVMAIYGFSVGELDVEFDESVEILKE
jgi:hypothetical protein